MLNLTVSSNTEVLSPSKPNMNSPNTMIPYEWTFSTRAMKFSGRLTCLCTFQRLARNRFEPDAEHGAATFGCEFEHAVILRKLGGNTRLPSNAASLRRTHQLLRTLGGAEEVGVVGRDGACATILHLPEFEPFH